MGVSQQDGARPRRSGAGTLMVLAVGIALGVSVWWGVNDRAKAMVELTRETREMAIPTVAVAHPTQGTSQEELVLPGTTQALTDAPIYARTGGYLKRRYVELGSKVKANQLLAELDAPELEQQIQQARADLATAEANSRLAQITADRYRDLVKTESVSQQDADNAAGTLDARKTAVDSARHNATRLEQLQSYTRIYAPFAGTITARNTDVGALIDPGSSGGATRELFHISVTNRLRLFVSVPELYIRATKPGVTAELTFAEIPGRTFPAKLVRTAETIDVASRTLLVEFDVPNPDGALLAGAYAEVHLKPSAPTSVFRAPANALIFRADGLKIAVVRGGDKVAMTTVVIGRDFGTEVEVVSGLKGDETIVVNPPDSLTDGQVVRLLVPGRGAAEGGKR
ncbi:MAG: efflux RND transporter periplasmic adaptor subunit [Acidobacteriota bacterium]